MNRLQRLVKLHLLFSDLNDKQKQFLKIIASAHGYKSRDSNCYYVQVHSLHNNTFFHTVIDIENKEIRITKTLITKYFNYENQEIGESELMDVCYKLKFNLIIYDKQK